MNKLIMSITFLVVIVSLYIGLLMGQLDRVTEELQGLKNNLNKTCEQLAEHDFNGVFDSIEECKVKLSIGG